MRRMPSNHAQHRPGHLRHCPLRLRMRKLPHGACGDGLRQVGSSNKKITVAQDMLKTKIGEVASGNFVSPKVQRIAVSELFEAVLTDYRNNGKEIRFAQHNWK